MGAILVVNAGSTSLKLRLVHKDETTEPVESLEVVRPSEVDAVGHRVVHGGPDLVAPRVIDDRVLASIRALEPLAPLHNAPALSGVETALRLLPDHRHVAVFVTAFHATMPAEAATYAIPWTWREDWGIRRYGFHGLSVQWSAERAAELLGDDNLRLVVCHLGGGCSVTGVLDGRSVDTTMGFTPLEGVPMGTRSGSVDPGALLYVQRAHGLTVDDVDRALNAESGFEGLSGGRSIRELEVAPRDESARLALQVYTYRIAAAVAAMGAALGGIDAIAFTAGVGEHSPVVRAAVCERLGFLGVELDREQNERSAADADIATTGSDVRVLVIAAREELVAARAVRALLGT